MEHTETKYSCDKCGKKLKTWGNNLDIVTSISESGYWSRLHVKIEHIHGVHNDSSTDQADLCKQCAISLLTDALKRVKAGERLSAGVETVDMLKWGEY